MLTKRTLENWRKDALKNKVPNVIGISPEALNITTLLMGELNQRIIRLTQELLDIELMKKG